MTLVSAIIKSAYRESNLVTIGATPTANETAEALSRLNTLVSSVFGNEVGGHLKALNHGGTYSDASCMATYIPVDSRVMANLTGAVTLKLHPTPYDGQRVGVTDILANFATYNLTLDGNGRKIEGVTSLALSTNGTAKVWMYRGDTGNWVLLSTLIETDQMPFPPEYDDFFITTLAMRLAPRNSGVTSGETVEALKRARSQLRARYQTHNEVGSDLSNRGLATDKRYYRGSDFDFNRGR